MNSKTGVPVLEAVTFGVFAEVQRGLSGGISGVRGVWSGYVGLRHVKAENDELKRQLAAAQIAAAGAARAGRSQRAASNGCSSCASSCR